MSLDWILVLVKKCKGGDWISYHLFFVFWSVVPVLFEYTLAPKKHVAKTPDALAVADVVTEMESPPSSVEVALALRVLEGCCLLYSACRTTASHHSAVSVRLWALLLLVNLAFRFTLSNYISGARTTTLECQHISAEKMMSYVNKLRLHW